MISRLKSCVDVLKGEAKTLNSIAVVKCFLFFFPTWPSKNTQVIVTHFPLFFECYYKAILAYSGHCWVASVYGPGYFPPHFIYTCNQHVKFTFYMLLILYSKVLLADMDGLELCIE